MGITNAGVATINTGTYTGKIIPQYRVNPKIAKATAIEAANLEKIGMLIEPEVIDFVCPSSGVWKDESKTDVRLIMDGRPLNEITVTDGYPMPRSDELIQNMCGRLFYAVIDLKSAYWQIAYDWGSVKKACVHTPGGVKAYTVMVMGLKNSAAFLQRVIERIL